MNGRGKSVDSEAIYAIGRLHDMGFMKSVQERSRGRDEPVARTRPSRRKNRVKEAQDKIASGIFVSPREFQHS